MSVRHIQSANVQLTLSEEGSPAHQPVVFLHGAGQTRHAWRRVAKQLADKGYYVLSMDLRGHGDSDWSPEGDYSSDAFVRDLKAVIASLDQKPILIGASLGGLMSLVTVGESDESLVKALVLVDITPRIDMEGRARIIGFMQSNTKGFANVEEAADSVAAYLPHRPRPKNPAGLMRNLRQAEDGRLYWHWDPRFFDAPEATHHDPESRYEAAAQRINIPTLLIRGEESELVSVESLKHFLAVIPNAEYVDVTGARHMVVGDDNDVFADAVIQFLAKLDD